MRMRSAVLLSVLVMLLLPELAIRQRPEYEFYLEFRKDFSQELQEANNYSLTREQVLEKYTAKLKTEGIGESEIERRLGLLRTERAALEADFYSRLYLDPNSDFNRAPNHFTYGDGERAAAGSCTGLRNGTRSKLDIPRKPRMAGMGI
jgi:hypothetical protein